MNDFPDNTLVDFLKKYGSHTIAYSSVYDENLTTFCLSNKGYIRYGFDKHTRFMLGDPICSKENLKILVESFIEDCNKNNHILIAMQCSYETALIFSENDYNANHMGVETILYLKTFDTKGKQKTKVRRWLNSAKNAGINVKEESFKNKNVSAEISEISKNWLSGKENQKELTLLTRPLLLKAEEDVRIFCGYQDDKIIAFNGFEPMYSDGKIIGYYANFCRQDESAPNGTLDLIMDKAREVFKSEGCEYFSFGMSPFSDINDSHQFHNPVISLLLETNYKYGNSLYSFKGLDFHKKAYHDGVNSERKPMYLISKGTLPINQMITTMSYMGILPNNSFITNLTYFAESVMKGFFREYKAKLITEHEIKNVMHQLIKGLSFQEISKQLKLNVGLIEELAKSFTEIGRKKLPAFQENVYIQKNLNEYTKEIFAKVEDIVDKDKEVFFVYNIGIHEISNGVYIMMTIEVEGKKSVAKANFISARIKSEIKNQIPNVVGIFVEIEPKGQYAYKIGLENVEEAHINL
jgi:hypothetical protein